MVTQSRRTISFGYYPDDLSIHTSTIAIETLATLEETVAKFSTMAENAIERDWVYAPVQERQTLGGKVGKDAYVSRIFGLAKTHTLTHLAPDGVEHLTFLVWALSFFLGIRLTTTEMGFIDATPIRPGLLVDFHLGQRDYGKALDMADTFWAANRHDPKRVKLFNAAVHALFIGQSPVLVQYESFLHLYMALEACFALASLLHPAPKSPTHAMRIGWLCKLIGIQPPDWAIAQGSRAEVPGLRNDTLHEALFMDEPLGFAIHGVGTGHDVTLEMQALICRVLVALIGAPNATYVTSRINTRQIHGLDIA
jgi:hypothetical protein